MSERKSVEDVLAKISLLERHHVENLERLVWGHPQELAADLTRCNETRQRLVAARELLKLLKERPELDPLHGIVHPGKL